MRVSKLTPAFHGTTPKASKTVNPQQNQTTPTSIKKSNKKLYWKIGAGAAVAVLGGLIFHSVNQAKKAMKEMPPLYFGSENNIKPEIIESFETLNKKAKKLYASTMDTVKEVLNNYKEASNTQGSIKTKSGSGVLYSHDNGATLFEKNHSEEMIRITKKHENGYISIEVVGETTKHPTIGDLPPIETYKPKDVIHLQTDSRIAIGSDLGNDQKSFKNFLVINKDNQIDYILENVVIGEDKKPKALKALLYKNGKMDRYIENETHKSISPETLKDCDKIYNID